MLPMTSCQEYKTMLDSPAPMKKANLLFLLFFLQGCFPLYGGKIAFDLDGAKEKTSKETANQYVLWATDELQKKGWRTHMGCLYLDKATATLCLIVGKESGSYKVLFLMRAMKSKHLLTSFHELMVESKKRFPTLSVSSKI
jgi:hypothetical protein